MEVKYTFHQIKETGHPGLLRPQAPPHPHLQKSQCPPPPTGCTAMTSKTTCYAYYFNIVFSSDVVFNYCFTTEIKQTYAISLWETADNFFFQPTFLLES